MSTSRTREKADGELFKSTGIDDNATSTKVTVSNTGIAVAGDVEVNFIKSNPNNVLTFKLSDNTTVGSFSNTTGALISNYGLAVGGTGAANTLDDYEEGTWTPTGTNLNAQGGRYTKVGNLVTCAVRFNASGGNVTGNIGGLPFTSSASINAESSGGGVVTWQNSEGVIWSCRVGANSAVNLHMYKGSSSAVLTPGSTAFLTFSYIAA